jgi:hypothetical protein
MKIDQYNLHEMIHLEFLLGYKCVLRDAVVADGIHRLLIDVIDCLA